MDTNAGKVTTVKLKQPKKFPGIDSINSKALNGNLAAKIGLDICLSKESRWFHIEEENGSCIGGVFELTLSIAQLHLTFTLSDAGLHHHCDKVT